MSHCPPRNCLPSSLSFNPPAVQPDLQAPRLLLSIFNEEFGRQIFRKPCKLPVAVVAASSVALFHFLSPGSLKVDEITARAGVALNCCSCNFDLCQVKRQV